MRRGEKGARRERGVTQEGPGRESRAFFMWGKIRVARQTRSLRPGAQKSRGPQTRLTVARTDLPPHFIPDRNPPEILDSPSRSSPSPATSGSLGPLYARLGGIRALSLRMLESRVARPAPSMASPSCLSPPHGRKGQRKMEGVCMPTPRTRMRVTRVSGAFGGTRIAGGGRKNDIPCTRDAYGRIMHARTRARLLYGSMHRERRTFRDIYVIRS